MDDGRVTVLVDLVYGQTVRRLHCTIIRSVDLLDLISSWFLEKLELFFRGIQNKNAGPAKRLPVNGNKALVRLVKQTFPPEFVPYPKESLAHRFERREKPNNPDNSSRVLRYVSSQRFRP